MTVAQAMSDRDGVIWLDGALVDWRDAKVHVLTHGLHYSSSVFEGIRAYGGRCFRLTEHIERLLYSAECLDMEIAFSVAELEDATRLVLVRNGLRDSYVRPFAWRGSEQLAAAAPNNTIHVAIAAWPLPNYFDANAKAKGIRLQIGRWQRPPASCGPVHAKCSSNYTITTLAKHRALANGFDDALLLDFDGNVAEATAANIFFARNGELHTPPADCFLNGITRQTVFTLAKELSIPVVERSIVPAEMSQFTECFVTGTASEITAVSAIEDLTFPHRTISAAVDAAYSALVRTTG
jgi:branched-chain amino acid aminotransferase